MIDPLSDADWQELSLLIEEAPPDRIEVAVNRVGTAPAASERPTRLVTCFDRLLHLAAISSGSAFDRALLHELRRLSVH